MLIERLMEHWNERIFHSYNCSPVWNSTSFSKNCNFVRSFLKKTSPKCYNVTNVTCTSTSKKKRLFLRDNKHFYNRASRNAEMPHFRNFPRSYAEKFKRDKSSQLCKIPPPLPTRGTSFKTDGNETRGAQRLREILFFFFLLRGETGGKLVSRNER